MTTEDKLIEVVVVIKEAKEGTMVMTEARCRKHLKEETKQLRLAITKAVNEVVSEWEEELE